MRDMPARNSKIDQRLLGTWRSDRRRTLLDAGWPSSKRKRWARIFGHLTLRYTRARVYSDYRGYKEIQEYAVLAADLDSVAITVWDSLRAERRIRHIHFEGNRYWITIGRHREWFRRIGKARA